jgi:hypothetical protein
MRQPYDREYYIPTPTATTRFFRTFLPWQVLRFVWINLKMVRMISIGHHGRAPLRPIVWPGEGEGKGQAPTKVR